MSPEKRVYAKRVPSGGADLWKVRRPLLIFLDIELTERCDNDCIHCSINRPAGDAEAARREMTAAEIRTLLEEAASLGCLTVRLTGGEPLLRDEFPEIYMAARSLGLKVMLFTNATLMTPRIAELLRAVPPLVEVEVSIYGLSRSSYEAVTRTPGSYDAARRGLSLLAEKRIPFVIKSALLPPNKKEMDEFDAWASALCGSGKGPAYAMLFDLRSRRDGGKNGLIQSQRIDPAEYAAITARRSGDDGREVRAFLARSGGAQGGRLLTCLPAKGNASIDAYGNLQYCLQLRHPDTVYPLKAGSLREAVTEFLPRLRELQAENPAYLERCGRCFLKPLCQQCPARSWAEHGTLDTPVEYFCEATHAQAVSIGVLQAGEKAWTVRDWKARIGRPARDKLRAKASGPNCQGERS